MRISDWSSDVCSSDLQAQWPIIVAIPTDMRQTVDSGAGKFAAQLCAGINEGCARHVQAHHLHHHLVGIGCAIESAGAGTMIGGAFSLQQLLLSHFPFRIKLANADLRSEEHTSELQSLMRIS